MVFLWEHMTFHWTECHLLCSSWRTLAWIFEPMKSPWKNRKVLGIKFSPWRSNQTKNINPGFCGRSPVFAEGDAKWFPPRSDDTTLGRARGQRRVRNRLLGSPSSLETGDGRGKAIRIRSTHLFSSWMVWDFRSPFYFIRVPGFLQTKWTSGRSFAEVGIQLLLGLALKWHQENGKVPEWAWPPEGLPVSYRNVVENCWGRCGGSGNRKDLWTFVLLKMGKYFTCSSLSWQKGNLLTFICRLHVARCCGGEEVRKLVKTQLRFVCLWRLRFSKKRSTVSRCGIPQKC